VGAISSWRWGDISLIFKSITTPVQAIPAVLVSHTFSTGSLAPDDASARGRCKQAAVKGKPSGRPYTGDIYVDGVNSLGNWRGDDARFCIDHRKNFTFTAADEWRCRGGNLSKAGMSKFAVKPGVETWNFR
jgi:hypothetical protein